MLCPCRQRIEEMTGDEVVRHGPDQETIDERRPHPTERRRSVEQNEHPGGEDRQRDEIEPRYLNEEKDIGSRPPVRTNERRRESHSEVGETV